MGTFNYRLDLFTGLIWTTLNKVGFEASGLREPRWIMVQKIKKGYYFRCCASVISRKYPKSYFDEKAREALIQRYWQETNQIETLDAYNSFLHEYPNSKFTNKAKTIIEDLKNDIRKKKILDAVIIKMLYWYSRISSVSDE